LADIIGVLRSFRPAEAAAGGSRRLDRRLGTPNTWVADATGTGLTEGRISNFQLYLQAPISSLFIVAQLYIYIYIYSTTLLK